MIFTYLGGGSIQILDKTGEACQGQTLAYLVSLPVPKKKSSITLAAGQKELRYCQPVSLASSKSLLYPVKNVQFYSETTFPASFFHP
jgi:hypothetical protein